MRNDRQSSFILSCPLLHIAQEYQGLRNLRVDHQIRLVTYQQATLIPVAAHFLPTPAQQIQILRALDIIRRILQVVGIQANKPGIGLQRGVAVPQKAVAARCGVVQQHCQITIYRIFFVGRCFLFQQGVKVGQNGEIRGLELTNIRFPEDAELIVEFNDRLLEDRFLHIRQAGQIQGKFNLQRFHVQRHIRHSVSFIGIELVGFIVLVTGRRSDLQKIGTAILATASIEPASVQVPAHILIFGFRVDAQDFRPLHVFRKHDVLYNGTLADTGHTHNHEAAIGAVVSAFPGVQNHQAAVAVLCKIIAPAIVVTGAGKREPAHKGTHGNNAGHNAVHRGVSRIGGRNALEPFHLEIGEGAHLALLDVEGALHTAADLCEVGLILCNRHHGQRHHGNRFALLVDPLHDFLAVLGGFLGALPGQRIFGTVSGAALLDNAFGDCGNERTIVNGGNPHRNNGAGDVGDLGKPPHIHLLRIADGAVHLTQIFTDDQTISLDFQPHRGNDI